jgi:predicted dehydrogenase
MAPGPARDRGPVGPVGFALLGAGAGAAAHAEALAGLPGARLAAVADPDLARAQALTARYGGVAVAEPEAALARDDVHAACVVAPNDRHGPLARAAARRGKAVLVEKPLAHRLDAAQAIVDDCAAAGVPLGVVLQNRFAPEVAALRAALQGGRLGRLVGGGIAVRCHRTAAYFEAGPWRRRAEAAGGGALIVQGIHMLDLLDWLAGPITPIAGHAATRVHPVGVEDVLAATVALPDGAPATVFCTTAAAPEFPARLELFGTAGSAVVLEARGSVRVWQGDGRAEGLAELAALEGGLAARLAAPWPMGVSVELHRAVLADFAECVRTGRPPAVDGAAGLRLQALVERIYATARVSAAGGCR